MGHIVIAWPAEERKSAGYGEIARVVLGQADFVAGDLYCRRKAAVEVKMGNVIDPDLSAREGSAHHIAHCGRAMHLIPFGDEPMIVSCGRPVKINPFGFGHAEFVGYLCRAEQDRRRLIHEHIRVHIAGVWIADVGVRVRDACNLLGSPRATSRRQRIRASDFRQSRH